MYKKGARCIISNLVNRVKLENNVVYALNYRYIPYRIRWELLNKFNKIPKYPFIIHLEIIDKCNSSCIMCPRSMNTHFLKSNKMMEYNLFKKIVDENNNFMLWLGQGDEPFLHNEIIKFIRYAKNQNVNLLNIFTNGSRLDKSISRSLINLKVNNINISLDSFSDEVYFKIRRRYFYDKVLSNIHTFLYLKKKYNSIYPFLQLSFIDMDINRFQKQDFFNYWKKYVNAIHYQKYVNNQDMIKEKLRYCLQPFKKIWIRYNGDVYPCCCFAPVNKKFNNELLMGNINQRSIKDIWFSKKMNKLRTTLYYKDHGNLPLTCKCCGVGVFKDDG